jgi:hypothetical protein
MFDAPCVCVCVCVFRKELRVFACAQGALGQNRHEQEMQKNQKHTNRTRGEGFERKRTREIRKNRKTRRKKKENRGGESKGKAEADTECERNTHGGFGAVLPMKRVHMITHAPTHAPHATQNVKAHLTMIAWAGHPRARNTHNTAPDHTSPCLSSTLRPYITRTMS